MTTIKAIVRNGRLEVANPIDLPDGTELTIPIPTEAGLTALQDDSQLDTPEAIDAWVRWYDALQPLEFTAAERAEWEAARQEQKDYELANWESRSRQIEGRIP